MSSAIFAHPRAVEADGRIEQHQRRDEIRAGRGEIQRDRTAERMPDHHDGPVGVAVEQRGERGDVGVDRPRRLPRRAAVAEQIGCRDREVGQVARWPASASACRARSARGWPGSAAGCAGP